MCPMSKDATLNFQDAYELPLLIYECELKSMTRSTVKCYSRTKLILEFTGLVLMYCICNTDQIRGSDSGYGN